MNSLVVADLETQISSSQNFVLFSPELPLEGAAGVAPLVLRVRLLQNQC